MVVKCVINPEMVYRRQEARAAEYLRVLTESVQSRTYVKKLAANFQWWKKGHLSSPVKSYIYNKIQARYKADTKTYINWLERTGKLDTYLDRSISYLYMRDLGKGIHTPSVKKNIQSTVKSLKTRLLSGDGKNNYFDERSLFRFAQKEQIEPTIIWIFEKLKLVSEQIPVEMDQTGSQRKLLKIIAGVLMHVMDEMTDEISQAERSRKLANAIHLGYAYGLTYPFIDDLLDANILSANEEKKYSELIRTTLVTGVVPDLGAWPDENADLLRFIHGELKAAFEYIREYQHPEQLHTFLEQAYVFFESQEVDRHKILTEPTYTNEDIYIPVILKSASSRLIVRSVLGTDEDSLIQKRLFYYGVYNQLADDFADMTSDLQEGAVTPFTYYLTHYQQRPDLVNPFELYWAVISYLIHEVYDGDEKTTEIILNRAMNGLKRYRERVGAKAYREFMDIFSGGLPFLTPRAYDVDFFDKLLRDEMVHDLKTSHREQDEFRDMVEDVRGKINAILQIPSDRFEPIVDAANYSLAGDGKRLRPIVTWVMGVDVYGLQESAIAPLVKSLEYLHTASLIFDDLPAQDNSSSRRGRPTLHRVYNVAVAEITGLFLTQKAIEEQTVLKEFDPQTVLELIQYSTKMTEWMCKGQALDLQSRGKVLSLEELETMCFYKTGLGFEASLIMPAILAKSSKAERQALTDFARHAGLVFQIKDDLLDVEGTGDALGKPVGQDELNNASTFVTVLGAEKARVVMWEHYFEALEALDSLPHETTFLKQIVKYFIHRSH